MINICISGYTGRLGTIVKELIDMNSAYQFIGGLSRNKSDLDICDGADLIIDLSHAELSDRLFSYLLKRPKKLICGTTGLSNIQMEMLKEISQKTAVLYSGNFSIGVAAFFAVLKEASKFLATSSHVHIIEKHHQFKKDAPSGTALRAAEIVNNERAQCPVEFHSVRAGNIVGEHQVLFFLPNEIIEIKHEALNRSVFADGIMTSIPFILAKNNGFYSIDDVLKDNRKRIV